ncbi:resolvase [Williamsia sp. 1138]|uniref:recombinase family protein n=1 Tax=Williamsia sp. 1138 TaxID=1903117 RepID=UPI000A0F7DCB|nr:recombinase family protein [Williamsia sp. 1138]OZG27697.1 resolvase [Williamsia sp. 1138]
MSKSSNRAENLRRALASGSKPDTVDSAGTKVETAAEQILPLTLVGYARVSTATQHVKGYGLRAQEDFLAQWCAARGHQLLTVTNDVISGTKAEQMNGRAVAIAAIEAGLADGLLVRALDRATRDQLDAASLYKQAEKRGWRLMDCDNADSSDPSQRLTADIRLAVAAEERRRISIRTKEGLARAKREGKKLGRPSRIDPIVVEEIVLMRRDEGLGPKAIATYLDQAQIPTPGGGERWHYATVRRVLKREGVA